MATGMFSFSLLLLVVERAAAWTPPMRREPKASLAAFASATDQLGAAESTATPAPTSGHMRRESQLAGHGAGHGAAITSPQESRPSVTQAIITADGRAALARGNLLSIHAQGNSSSAGLGLETAAVLATIKPNASSQPPSHAQGDTPPHPSPPQTLPREQPQQQQVVQPGSQQRKNSSEQPGGASGHPGKSDQSTRHTNFYTTLEFLVRVLMVLVVVELIAAVAFEWSHQRWVNVDFGRPLPSVLEQRRTPLGRIFAGFPRLMRPYFCHPAGTKGRICAFSILVLGILSLFFSFVHNKWQKEWWDLFNKSDAKRFPELMGCYALMVTAWILNSVYTGYVRSWLYIDWREFMTWQFMQRWLASHSHFLIQLSRGEGQKRVDNPEQRLQEDIHLFIENALNIIPEFLSSVGNLAVFIPVVLWLEPEKAFGVFRLPGWLLYLAIVYSALGSLTTHIIGWPMVNFSFAKQRYEADFRGGALHVRDQAESVALYSSEATEEAALRQQFDRIKLVQWRQMIVTKRLTFFTSAYGFVQFLVPFFILAPSYFRKDLTLGDLFQLTGAIGNVANSFDWFLRVYGSLASWRATADRLISFEAAIACVQVQATHCASSLKQQKSDSDENSDKLQAEVKEVRLPTGELLWQDICLQLRRGQSALISGPEGAGKSVLFKSLAGVWPHVEGCSVRLPVDDPRQVLFVPQRPALPKRCSLGQALAYPELRGAYTDEAMYRALRDVRLEQLALEAKAHADSDGSGGSHAAVEEACPEPAPEPAAEAAIGADSGSSRGTSALDRVEDWSSLLSPGQQQRLAIGHVLLRRPAVLFMDEATASVGKEGAVELYRTVMKQLSPQAIVVSISHDVDILEPLHDVHLATYTVEGVNQLQMLKGPGLELKVGGSKAEKMAA